MSLCIVTLVVAASLIACALLPTPSVAASLGDGAGQTIEVILQAQAALMAISLAVVAIVVGGIRRHQDADDPLYEWFLAYAGVRPFFGLVVTLTLGTVTAFVLSRTDAHAASANLALFGIGSIALGLLAITVFAYRTLEILQPGRYREYKRRVTVEQVRIGCASYLEHVRSAAEETLRSRSWRSPLGQAADRALERIIDDAERSIRDGRFADYRDALTTIRCSVKMAMVLGGPHEDALHWPVDKSYFHDWPVRRPLRHGLNRLRATAFGERREDYAAMLFDLCREWLFDGTEEDHVLLVDLATAALADEYLLACEDESVRASERSRIGIRVSALMFRYLRSVLSQDEWQLSDARRHEISVDMIELAQQCAGEMLVRGDRNSLLVWLEAARDYMAALSYTNMDEYRIGSHRPRNNPSILAHIRLAVAALGGRALDRRDADSTKLFVDTMEGGTPSAFTVEDIEEEMKFVEPAWPPLGRTWQNWLEEDNKGKVGPFVKPGRYPLLFCLWFAYREPSILGRRLSNTRLASQLDRLEREDGEMVSEAAHENAEVRARRRREIAKWLSPTPAK